LALRREIAYDSRVNTDPQLMMSVFTPILLLNQLDKALTNLEERLIIRVAWDNNHTAKSTEDGVGCFLQRLIVSLEVLIDI